MNNNKCSKKLPILFYRLLSLHYLTSIFMLAAITQADCIVSNICIVLILVDRFLSYTQRDKIAVFAKNVICFLL